MTYKLLAIKIKIRSPDTAINLYNKLQVDIKKIGYNSWSEVIADLTRS